MLPDISRFDGLLKEIYIDLARPGVSQVGKAIGAVLGLGNTVLWPLHLLNERARIALEANLDRYRRRLENAPVEQVEPVPPEIAVPILEQLSYVSDGTLSEMYAGLLANASLRGHQQNIHPTFIRILASLSPDEALLLQQLLAKPVGYALTRKTFHPSGTKRCTLRFSGISRPLTFPDMTQIYLINLSSLGLVSGVDPAALSVELNLANRMDGDSSEETHSSGGTAALTKLGRLFLVACGEPSAGAETEA